MTSIEKRTRDKKISWLARWRDPDGRQRKRTFSRKVDAERFLTSISSSMLVGNYVDPAAGRETVGAYARTWLDRQVQLKPSTRAWYATIIQAHIEPTFGATPLSRMERSTVATWVAGLAGSGRAPATVRGRHRVLSIILASAVTDGRIARNVASGVPLPRAKGRTKRFLDHGQVAALAEATGEYGLLVRVLAFTGLRFGEAAALRVADVDLLRRRLTVARSVTEVNGHLVWGEPKSHHARSVPIPASLVTELARVCEGKRPEDLLFTAPDGGALWLRNWRRRVFDPAARADGLDGLTPHELRHTAASLAVAAGANVKAVQQMLGHASAAMTLDVYAGLFDDHLDAVAERMDQAAAAARRDPDVPRTCPEGTVTPFTVREQGR
jgi:integrase